jgi:hypothetical protein
MGFYNWNLKEFRLFLEGNRKFSQDDYESISKVVQTKTVDEVKKYSEKYFEKAKKLSKLKKEFRKI